MKKLLCAVIAVSLLALAAGGCAPSGEPSQSPGLPSAPAPTQTAPSPSQESELRAITDMAGRELELPANINKIYCTDPVSAITLYTFAPQKLLGWNYAFNEMEKKFILPESLELPVFGMGDAVNLEAVIAASPDICIYMGKISDSAIEDADKLSNQLGVPVAVMDGSLRALPDSYEFMGELLNMPERGGELSQYARRLIDNAPEIPEEEKVSVYYGNGADSLETAPVGSVSAEVFELVGAANVARVETTDSSRVDISAEQLLKWNPDYIFVDGQPKKDVSGFDAARSILENPDYKSISAVKNGRVYGIPKVPFAWMVRPQGPNRLIGIAWVGSILYPDYYTADPEAEIKSFYKTFYHIELSDGELAQIMGD